MADRMPWFKWWDGTATDMKFRMVAEDCGLPVSSIVGAWAYLLEHASRSVNRGSIADMDLELMAYTLQIPDCETVCNAMKRRKLLHENGEITKWEDRQGKREKSEPPGASTERVRKLRALQKANGNNGLAGNDDENANNGNVTDETACNGTKRPKKKNREEEESKPKPTSSSGDDGVTGLKPFDQFWEAYPRKQAKMEAQKAWTKLKLDGKVNEIVQAIEAQKEGHHWRREEGRYIPHPASWLRAGCWLDEVQAYVAPPIKLPPGWWETPEGMKAAGAMLDPPLVPGHGEGQKAFAHRIRVAVGQVDAPPAAASMAPPVAAPYTPPAPPPGVELTDEQRKARRDEYLAATAKLKQSGNLATAGVAAGSTE